MDDAVGRGGLSQAVEVVEVVEIAATDLGAGGRQCGGGALQLDRDDPVLLSQLIAELTGHAGQAKARCPASLLTRHPVR